MTNNPGSGAGRVWSHDILPELETWLAMSGQSRFTFGRGHFGDTGFVDRMRKGVRLKSSTLAKLAIVRAKAERGELRPQESRCRAADYLPRMHAAREALGLGEYAFAERYLGDGTFFARARRIKNFKPETAQMIDRVLSELGVSDGSTSVFLKTRKKNGHGN